VVVIILSKLRIKVGVGRGGIAGKRGNGGTGEKEKKGRWEIKAIKIQINYVAFMADVYREMGVWTLEAKLRTPGAAEAGRAKPGAYAKLLGGLYIVGSWGGIHRWCTFSSSFSSDTDRIIIFGGDGCESLRGFGGMGGGGAGAVGGACAGPGVCERVDGVCERAGGACDRVEGVCERIVAGVVGREEVFIDTDLMCDELNRERGEGDDELYVEGGVGDVDGGRGDWWG
jgi:hypothetical protein